MLSNGFADKACALLSLDIKTYPNSPGAYDSMGDYYASQKDNMKAADYYKKSLALKENPDVRKKLEGLGKK